MRYSEINKLMSWMHIHVALQFDMDPHCMTNMYEALRCFIQLGREALRHSQSTPSVAEKVACTPVT
jgi:hypothetical protein